MVIRRWWTSVLALGVAVLLGLVGCSSAGSASGDASELAGTGTVASGSIFDSSEAHEVIIDVGQDDLTLMLQTYMDSGDKDWVSATVTMDGTVFENVGIKLKGNSSLRGVTTESAPQDLPWRIKLDKYVSGANLDGYTDFTVRANSTETSLNEAVALDLLGTAGLASEQAVESSFSVNGSDAQLRLVVQNLDESWVADNFPDAGSDSVLYKAEADGSWSWLGSDADYSDSFDIEAGPDDYAPLVQLLDLVNNGTEEEIAAQLPNLLDIDSFATYLAFEELVNNSDDIDGPGNNSYLFWDSTTQKFTVVAWDHNLAFGGSPGGMGGTSSGMPSGMPSGMRPSDMPSDWQSGGMAGGQGNGMPAGQMPSGMPSDMQSSGGAWGGGMPGGMGGNNPLVTAFEANEEWTALKTQAASDLQSALIDSGALTSSLDRWVEVVKSSGLIDEATITSEADQIRSYA